MRHSKRILLGAVALAIPLATVSTFGGPAFAKKPPPNPVSCSLEATVTISPALTVAGQLSSKGQNGSTSVEGTLFNCTTAAGSVPNITLPLSITTPASKPGSDSAAIAAGDNKKDYYLGLCGTFASSATIKDLKKAVKNLAFEGGVLKGAKPSEGTVGSDVGFNITNGTVKGGTYPTASHGASIAAGLTNDANNSNLISGCQSGPVSTIDIDSSVSNATL
jgi:hypothetical protein